LIDGVNGIRSARWVFCFEKHIARLYHDDQLRKQLGQAARRHIQQFDWEVVADNILKYLG
jgi:glycosyltransferase involved in cell wall biosynthesis